MTSSDLSIVQSELRQSKIKDLDMISSMIKKTKQELQEAVELKLDLRPIQKALAQLMQDYQSMVTYYNRIEV